MVGTAPKTRDAWQQSVRITKRKTDSRGRQDKSRTSIDGARRSGELTASEIIDRIESLTSLESSAHEATTVQRSSGRSAQANPPCGLMGQKPASGSTSPRHPYGWATQWPQKPSSTVSGLCPETVWEVSDSGFSRFGAGSVNVLEVLDFCPDSVGVSSCLSRFTSMGWIGSDSRRLHHNSFICNGLRKPLVPKAFPPPRRSLQCRKSFLKSNLRNSRSGHLHSVGHIMATKRSRLLLARSLIRTVDRDIRGILGRERNWTAQPQPGRAARIPYHSPSH